MARRKGTIDPELLALEKCNLITNGSEIPPNYRDRVVNFVEKMQMVIASRPAGESFKFKLENFEFGGKLGTGRFGTVFLVKEKMTDLILALKSVEKELLNAANIETDFEREVRIHSKLSHSNIVRFYTLIQDTVNWYILMEYVPGGNLTKYRLAQKDGRAKPSVVVKFSYQLADALSYLHSLKIVHRDIRPDNILLDVFGNAKLTDFGWAACCTCALNQYCGSTNYIAPEILEEKSYSHKVDIWSLGVVIYELLYGEIPFLSKDVKFMLKKMHKGNISFPDADYTEESAADLIKRLLKYDPKDRLDASDIITHPWINS